MQRTKAISRLLSTAYRWLSGRHHVSAALAYFVIFMVCGGATCARKRSLIPEFNPPPVFTQGTPTLEQVLLQTNHSIAIQSLSSNSLTITSPEIPFALNGHFRWERPDKFRLETKMLSSALGAQLAAGSNSDLFWLQTSRPSPTIFYARHDEFEAQQGSRHVLPVSPLWLREAFGVIDLDPMGSHHGPTTRADGKLELVSQIESLRGGYKRVLVMAPTTATLEETYLYDAAGKLIASARMSQHQFYSSVQWSLPHQVQVQLMPDVGETIAFTVDVGYYQINEPSAANSFAFPDTTGLNTVDLVRINGVQPSPIAMPANLPGAMQPITATNASFPATQPVMTQLPSQPAVQASPITTPVYRTQPQATSMQNWQDNLRR